MSLIDSFKTDDVTVTTFGKGNYEKGVFKQGDKHTSTVKAVVIPIRGRELLKLSEGQRSKEAITVYTKDKLCSIDDRNAKRPDHLEWRGHIFQVQMVEDRTETDINHYKTVAVKIENQSDQRKLS